MNASTGLELIVASPGNSGSTSVHVAAEALGLRTYGSEEFIFNVPDLPMDHLEEVDWTGPGSPLKQCGVQAVVADLLLMPLVLQFVPQSPEAKIVLLSRTWLSWTSSKSSMQAKGPSSQLAVRLISLALLCHWLPYGLFWPRAEVGASFMRASAGISMELLDHCLLLFRARDASLLPRKQGDALQFDNTLQRMVDRKGAYREFLDDFRSRVPAGRLVEVNISDFSWERLSALTGRPAALSGKLPRAKVGGFGKILVRMYLFPAKHLAFLGLSLLSMAVNWLMFRAVVATVGRFRDETKHE